METPLGPTKIARGAGTGGSVPVEQCQICGSEKLDAVLSLGYMPPVNPMVPIGQGQLALEAKRLNRIIRLSGFAVRSRHGAEPVHPRQHVRRRQPHGALSVLIVRALHPIDRRNYFFACRTRVSNDSQMASSFSMPAVSTDAGSRRFDRRRRFR